MIDDPGYRRAAESLGARIRADAESSALVDELEAAAVAPSRAQR